MGDKKPPQHVWYVTFLLVEWWQDAVVSADLEVDLLLNTFRDGTLWDNYADTCLNRAQDATVGVEDAPSCRNHCVALIFILVIIQGTGAKRQIPLLSHTHVQQNVLALISGQTPFVTSRVWPWEQRWCCCAGVWNGGP